jgi:hypothetical protein
LHARVTDDGSCRHWIIARQAAAICATEDADCTFLFITNKAFDIHHVATAHG